MKRRTPHRRRLLAIGMVVATASACAEPDLVETAAPPTEADDLLSEPAPDPARDALLETLETLTATIAAAQGRLDTAAASDDDAETRAAAAAALTLLLDDADRLSSSDPSLFPARATERGDTAERDDLLSATLTAAREADGPLGRATVEVLREPVAGDLGSWERDAQGVVASATSVVQGASDVEAVTEQVLTLPADGLRALAWTWLATETRDADVTRAAAERGSAHLAVVLIGLGLLDTSDAATDPATDDDPPGPDAAEEPADAPEDDA